MHYAIIGLTAWVLCGMLGYAAMFSCDLATGQKLCDGEFYVIDEPVFYFFIAIITGFVATLIGIDALRSWWSWTHLSRPA